MTASQPARSRTHLKKLLSVLAITWLLQVAACMLLASHLTDDPDGYLRLAHSVAAGNGLQTQIGGQPTAFRPPTLPSLLALFLMWLPDAFAVAALNLAFKTLLIICVYRLAVRLKIRPAWLPCLITASDPLLLHSGTLPMTEVTAAGLLLLAIQLNSPLYRGESRIKSEIASSSNDGNRIERSASWQHSLLSGLALGALVLCRPSLWPAVIGLMAIAGLDVRERRARLVALLAGIAVLVGPWMIRNQVQLGAPIATTTHGGYTLFLGNNDSFYHSVVEQDWNRVWDDEQFRRWQSETLQRLTADVDDVSDERTVDAWYYARAGDWIRSHPRRFLHSSLVRLLRFWNLRPMVLPESRWQPVIGTACAIFYGLLIAAAGLGLIRGLIRRDRFAITVLVVVIGLSGVHSVYWSNMRFRAVISPLLALLACSHWRPGRPETS